jgi:hypothetical protein
MIVWAPAPPRNFARTDAPIDRVIDVQATSIASRRGLAAHPLRVPFLCEALRAIDQ